MRPVDSIFKYCISPARPYLDMLDRTHQHLLPRTYVEIGVNNGQSLTLALPGTACIGIDPSPRIQFPVRHGNRIFTETSDDFFSSHSLAALFGGTPLDLAFIDGMHHFEFALRDFINLERSSHSGTTILIHDCLPVDEVTASRDRSTRLWSGDVWRLIVLLRQWRPDLEVAVVDWPPTGVGVVRGLDAHSTVLSDHYDEIVDRYMAVPYTALDDGTMDEQLNRVPGNWSSVEPLLPGQPFRSSNIEYLKIRRAASAASAAAGRAARRAYGGYVHRRAPTHPSDASTGTFEPS